MKKIYADIMQFRGTHYDFGLKQGERLRDSILVKNRENQWKVRRPRFNINVEETREIYKRLAPLIWEELLGFQDALSWPMERVLLEFGGYRVKVDPSGCSIFTGGNYLIRNYDYHPKTYDGIYSLYQPSDGGNAIIGVCQKVTGRSDGMNEKGLAMGYTFMHRKRPGDGFVCNMIGRLILELCENVDEAVELLKEIPHRGSFSYVLFDKNSNLPSIVETSPRRVEIRQGNACTNHFKIMTEENRHVLNDSKKRLQAMEAAGACDLNGEAAFRLLNDTNQGVFSKLYGDWAGTIHTSAYFPSELEAWYALGGDREPERFNFAAWLKGDYFHLEKVEGEVDTKIPFVNMEKADWFKT